MKTRLGAKIESDEFLNKISVQFPDVEIYCVGGIVRDFYLGKENFDKDLIVQNIDACEFAKILGEKLDATFIPLDEENKIYRLVLDDKKTCIDITNPVENSIEKDLKRRDFTINSIAVNLKTLEIVDINNGIKDLKNKKIRMIEEKNFSDDPLRLLRAYRFQAVTGFDLDSKTAHSIKKHLNLINS